jgi:hypothetical protein
MIIFSIVPNLSENVLAATSHSPQRLKAVNIMKSMYFPEWRHCFP